MDNTASHKPVAGYLDRCSDKLEGWVYPGKGTIVCCKIGDWEFQTTAHTYRADVREAGYGDGFSGFSLALPQHLLDGSFHPLKLWIPSFPNFRFPNCPDEILPGIPEIEIRPLRREEIGAYIDFWETHLADECDSPGVAEQWSKDDSFGRVYLSHAEGLLFVLWAHSRIAGFCLLEPKVHEGYRHVATLRIALLRPYRSKGLGSRLLQVAIDGARSSGFRRIELTVNTHNVVARKLYDRLEFREEGVLRDHYFDGQRFSDEWIMARVL